MELKSDGRIWDSRIQLCSNCTFMELKFLLSYFLPYCFIGSNCTFMELKYVRGLLDTRSVSCSNCTFMELKYRIKLRYNEIWGVLIVPLWNWNAKGKHQGLAAAGSNCSFMVLKYWFTPKLNIAFDVLIVPLWNWNMKWILVCSPPNYVF